MEDKILEKLSAIIKRRKKISSTDSYVSEIFKKGKVKIANKVGEEAIETISAFLSEGNRELAEESADLIFHLLIMLEESGLSIEDVFDVLKKRMKDD